MAAVEQTKYGRVYEAGRFISPGRKQRFAVVESGYCLAAALLPAIEPIDYVTILPSIKSPVGRTVLKVGFSFGILPTFDVRAGCLGCKGRVLYLGCFQAM